MIDSNCLQSKELEDFLSASPRNVAVITDYAGMEIYKARMDTAVHASTSILARHPQQVLVLRGTKAICGLRGKQAGLTRRMIDEIQTREFPNFCRATAEFANGDERYRGDIQRKQKLARDHLARMATDSSDITSDYEQFESMFTENEIRNIRLERPIDWSSWKKFFFLVARLAESLHESHPCTKRWPSSEEWPNTFLYRMALFQLLYFFDWVRRGSPAKLSAEKIRNDQVDINFGVYATYFDGLLTKDRKSYELYEEAVVLLNDFIIPMNTELASGR